MTSRCQKLTIKLFMYILQFGSLLPSIQAYALMVVLFIYLQGIFEHKKVLRFRLSTIANGVYESIVRLCL